MAKETTVFYNRENSQRIIDRDDGTTSVQSGGLMGEIDAEGNMTASIDTISSVCIDNVFHLESYNLLDEGDVIRHNFSFADHGGTVILAYRSDGRLLQFDMNGVGVVSITKDGKVTIRKKGETEAVSKE